MADEESSTLLEEQHLLLIFGDSWCAFPGSWPEVFAQRKNWPFLSLAEGGCTSYALPHQVSVCSKYAQTKGLPDFPKIAIIHIGGNDIQQTLCCFGVLRLLQQLVLFFLQAGIWLGCCVMTLGCFGCRRRMAGRLLQLIVWPMDRLWNDGMPTFTPGLILDRIERAMHELERTHGVRCFVVSGIPVSMVVPLVGDIFQALLGICKPRGRKPSSIVRRCLSRVGMAFGALIMSTILCLWRGSVYDQFEATCRRFERKHPGCTVLFFDEATTIEAVVQARSSTEAERQPFWMDSIHPTLHGHSLIATEVVKLWSELMESKRPNTQRDA
eukprot:gnl/MRDRNA2_/MRDRNA2_74375_c0_seq1.p1 gnl/MRDRNA2_/MRDRNA2_74375_c0~~gnl/MRDRNA2_/MRDRNA2_74375_c0_seq1.p1  ORF type:complete len:356 (+),score=21.19 gnl/MRDRNA2_/MRDRNA2_74375_c0_seq1:93-1070(+)